MCLPTGVFATYRGTPFLYLGDTAWELIYRLNEPEVELYMENRRAKGFTVIQTIILSEARWSDGINQAIDKRFSVYSRPDYFKWVDRVLEISRGERALCGITSYVG